MSSMDIDAFSRTVFEAGIGPVSIMTGSSPAKANATTFALGLRPSFSRPASFTSITAAAPSQI